MLRPRALPVLVVALVAFAGCGSDGDGAASDGPATGPAVGTVLPTVASADVEGRTVQVPLPGVAYDITVSSPRDEVTTEDDDGRSQTLTAADGTAFVGVVDGVADPGGEAYSLGGLVDPETEVALALVVDGEATDVGTVDDAAEGLWVVVPEDADEIGVSVTYDGLEQTAVSVARGDSFTGAPDLLYDDPGGLFQARCSDVGAEDVDIAPGPESILGACTVRATEPVPYVTGLGWAPSGQGWVVADVGVITVVAGYEDAGSNYGVDATAMTVELDGAGPAEVQGWPDSGSATPREEAGGRWEGRVVFSVVPDRFDGELSFSRTFAASAQDPADATAAGAPEEFDGAYTATFTIG